MSRFIPVYTGNTCCDLSSSEIWPVYPCVYREHKKKVTYKIITVRFIPVYTGNASLSIAIKLYCSVYPCVYRERFRTDRVNNWQSGLSLCIQGTHYRAQEVVHRVRFIPVYTGNASRFTIQKLHLAVYPCVYRERCIEFCNIAHYLRFIPVYTGNAKGNKIWKIH